MRLAAHAACAVAAAAAAGCSASEPSARRPAEPQVPAVEVTFDDGESPESCSPATIARVISVWMARFNSGDAKGAAEAFSPSMRWLSMTAGDREATADHVVVNSPSEVASYFAERHEAGERQQLLELQSAYDRAEHQAHLAFKLRRTADDLKRKGFTNTSASGKGAFDCASGKLLVWTVAMPKTHADDLSPLCPESRDAAAAGVACTQR